MTPNLIPTYHLRYVVDRVGPYSSKRLQQKMMNPNTGEYSWIDIPEVEAFEASYSEVA